MARAPRKKKQPLTHAEKLQRSIRDTKDVLILLGLLLVVLVIWDGYFINETNKLRDLEKQHAETRAKMVDLETGVTPAFAKEASERRKKSNNTGDLRSMVAEIVVAYNVPTEVAGKIIKGNLKDLDIASVQTSSIGSTTTEYVELKKLRQVELWRLIEMFLKIEEYSDNTAWCTQINGLEPIRDPNDGFVMETTQGKPVYNVKSLRISRFSENKDDE